jgi:competence protein ComEC
VVNFHAGIEPHWRIPTPPLWLAVAFSAALIAAALARGRWFRAATGAAVAALLALLLWSPFPPDTQPGQLEMATIDVGQGDSIFVALPDGKRLLVDAGGIPAFRGQPKAQLDIGEDVVAPYLWNRGIRSLDVVAASHGHEDHIGGMAAIIDDFHPKELWIAAEPDSAPWRAVREAAARNGVKIVALESPSRFAFGGAEVQVLAPMPGYTPAGEAKNDDSLVLRLSYGRRSFLLTGDVERPVERWMVDDNEIERTDVLKTPHHGSRTSSTAPFLDAVSPAFAVISLGFENSYGFPNREVLDRLRERGVMVFRTDQDGLVSIHSDGRRLRVETNREMAAPGATPAW